MALRLTPEALTTALRSAQVAATGRYLPRSVGVELLVALLILMLLQTTVPMSWLAPWFMALIAANALRLALCHLQKRGDAGDQAMQSPARWERLHAECALVAGICWGILPLILPTVLPALEFVVAAVLAGVAVGGLAVYACNRRIYPLFALPILLGQASALLFHPAAHATPMLLAWLGAGAVVWIVARVARSVMLGDVARKARLDAVADEQRALFEGVGVGVLVAEGEVVVDCNPALADMFGYSREQLIGRPTQQLLDGGNGSGNSKAGAPANALNPASSAAMAVPDAPTLVFPAVRRERGRHRDGRALELEVRTRLIDPADANGAVYLIIEDITEALQLAGDLTNHKERLRQSLDALPSGLWDHDCRSGRFFFSRRFQAIIGHPEGSELDEPQWQRLFAHHEAIHPEDRDRIADARKEFLLHGVDLGVEYRLLLPGGSRIWIHETAKALCDEQGQPVRYTGSITDVTNLNLMQEKLQASEGFHRHLIEASNSLIWRSDKQGVLTYVNELGARELYGYEPAEMLGKTLADLAAPALTGRDARLLFDGSTERKPVRNAEIVHLDKSGRRIYLSINAVPVYDEIDGSYVGAMGINTDITHLKKRERAFQDSVRLQRLIFDSAGEGIVMIRNGRVHRANQAFADLVGATIGDIVARVLGIWFDDQLEWEAVELQLTKFGNVIKVEQQIRRTDGRLLWVAVTGRIANTGEDGQTYIWVFADISARKAQEEQSWYRANHDELTGLPNRRLLQDRLKQAMVRARRESILMAVLMIDLDGFKEINDVYGHNAGDDVLRQVSRRLTESVRQLDTVARLGGDEFVIVLHHVASQHDVEVMATRVIEQVRQPMEFDGNTYQVSASLGVSMYPESSDTIAGLMHAADMAMYASKASGKDTYRIAEPAIKPTPRKVPTPV